MVFQPAPVFTEGSTDMATRITPAQLTARRRDRPQSLGGRRLDGARVLIVDGDWATCTLLRSTLEQDHGCAVEVASNYDAALDVLGNAARPVQLVMLEPALGVDVADALMKLLQQHRAAIHVTLHGVMPPEKLAFPGNFAGAAAYTHLATSAQTVATAGDVMRAGLTLRAIADTRIIPATLDWTSAIAIYQGDPGQAFPLTVRM